MNGLAARRFFLRLLTGCAILVAVFYGLVFALPYWVVSQTKLTPPKIFEAAFDRPPPASVADLQGAGWSHLGYRFHLRFRVPPPDLPQFLESRHNGDWKPTTWEAVSEEFAFRHVTDAKQFRPPWEPETTTTKEVYSRGKPQGFTDYLLLDRATGVIYFTGHGT